MARGGIRLSPAMRAVKEELRRAQEENERLKEALRVALEESRCDPLTSLPNRRAFDEVLEKEVARARRHSSPLVVVYADFDYLKSVNDLYGHAAGDRVIREFGSLICSSLRSEDSCARLGGDEFALILPTTSEAQARAIVERLASQVREHLKVTDGERSPMASASFGYAELIPDEEVVDFLKRVDNKLYEWKLRHRPAFRGA